jgi:hypothetical protein
MEILARCGVQESNVKKEVSDYKKCENLSYVFIDFLKSEW